MRSLGNTHDLAEIEDRLSALQPDDARLWGSMCVEEMLRHLRVAFRLAMGEVEGGGAAPSMIVPRGMLKFFALRAPMQWPHGVPTFPALKQGAPLMAASSLEEERDGVLQEMRRFCQPEQFRGDHGLFGAMSDGDWMRWGYLHMDHHLRQFGR
jgi:hypothetical protein